MGMKPDLILKSRRVVLPGGTVPAAISVRNGIITAIGPWNGAPRERSEVDAGEAVVMPGLVDTHVHVNEPGRTDWEGFETATRAAAAGGVTTIIDMPLNSIPPTTTLAGLAAKAKVAEGRCHVDYGFWGGVVPGNAGELEPLLDAGVLGFKAFLVPSGVDEFPDVSADDLAEAMPILAGRGVPLLVHAECLGQIRPFRSSATRSEPLRRYADYLASRPAVAEEEAVRAMIDRCGRFGGPVHIVHVSSAGTIGLLENARSSGLPLTTETCPHYLVFAAEEMAAGETLFKCAPPIRERTHAEALWEGLQEGVLDMVVSDHSPCPPAMKRLEQGDFAAAWGGIASLGLGLSAVWTGADPRGVSMESVSRWMCAAPARLAGLADRKGTIEIGKDADFVVWEPDLAFEVAPARLHDRHRLTPYEGRTLRGVVRQTYVRGRLVYDNGSFTAAAEGRWLRSG